MACRLGLGTANLAAPYGYVQDESLHRSPGAVDALLDAALEAGVRVFDTAGAYGAAEELLGAWLGRRPGADVEVVSKFRPESWRADLEASRRRLGGRLRALLWHNFDPTSLAPAGLAEAVLPQALGCSTYGPEAALAAVESGRFSVVEIEFSLLNPHVWAAVREPARRRGVSLILRSVLHRGYLTEGVAGSAIRVQADEAADRRIREVGRSARALAAELGMPLEELALRYVLSRADDATVLFGAATPAQVRANVVAAGKPALPESTLVRIEGLVEGEDPGLFDLRTWI